MCKTFITLLVVSRLCVLWPLTSQYVFCVCSDTVVWRQGRCCHVWPAVWQEVWHQSWYGCKVASHPHWDGEVCVSTKCCFLYINLLSLTSTLSEIANISSCYFIENAFIMTYLSDFSSVGSSVLVEPLFFFWVHSYPVFWRNCLKRAILKHHLTMTQSLRLVSRVTQLIHCQQGESL